MLPIFLSVLGDLENWPFKALPLPKKSSQNVTVYSHHCLAEKELLAFNRHSLYAAITVS